MVQLLLLHVPMTGLRWPMLLQVLLQVLLLHVLLQLLLRFLLQVLLRVLFRILLRSLRSPPGAQGSHTGSTPRTWGGSPTQAVGASCPNRTRGGHVFGGFRQSGAPMSHMSVLLRKVGKSKNLVSRPTCTAAASPLLAMG